MAGEDNSYGRRKKDTRRKSAKGHREFEGDHRQKGLSGWGPDGTVKPEKPFKHKNTSEPKTYRLRFCFLFSFSCVMSYIGFIL